MLNKEKFPILEFDDNPEAIISPYGRKKIDNFPHRLVITFFKDAIMTLLTEKKIKEFAIIPGENNLIVYKYIDCDVALIHGVIGGPACGGFLEDLIGNGVTQVMFCGGAGVLNKTITVGKLLVVASAIRDEGLSYHYLPPSRMIEADPRVVGIIKDYLSKENIDYLEGTTWTTDAFYRETKDKIQRRKEEGAFMVEMEQASLLAITQFRQVDYGAIIYGGDDVSGHVWDTRGWHSRTDIRYGLVEICKNIVQII